MNRDILKLAIPFVISNISVPILGMVDLALLGHLDTPEPEDYIGAIALGGMIFNIIYWGFSFLRMGTSGFTAQAFGRRDQKEIILIFSRAMLVAVLGSLLLILLQNPLDFLSFWIMDGSPEVEVLASEYFHIRIFAAPATISLYAFTGWFLGIQNARYPMIITIVINILNLGFNVLFIYGFGMKHDGVALGTVLAQYSGLLMSFFFFHRKYKHYLAYWEYRAMVHWDAIRQFFTVNRDIFIRTLLLIFTFSFFTNESASMGDATLAVNTILLQYLFVFSYFIDGFANAAEALVGKFVGAGNPGLLKKSIRRLFVWGVSISVPFSLLYFMAGENLLYLLTNEENVIQRAMPFLFWIAMVPIVTFAAFIWDGVFIGATATAPMRNTLIIATLVIFLPSYYIFRDHLGNHGLWLAMMLFMLTRGIMLALLSKKYVLSTAD
ncbi:MAG: MATE family efflux transporter [Bacteroidales bacterium]|nr:MATE family efflux transporter [Bacteroidales bacterium]MCF8388923.1 MATE family efflux transporter [Bacteroidales bacterium]MCF8398080.1 MATE family efflux transporter [Bacteroidales bacterium]